MISGYWRISLCNASSLNRGIQLRAAICAATRSSSACECISGAIFSGAQEDESKRDKDEGRYRAKRRKGRERGGGGEGGMREATVASFRAFHPSRLCGIQLRLTPRNYISRATRPSLLSFAPRPRAALSFARLSLIEIQDAPWNVCRDSVLNHVVILSEKFRTAEKLYPSLRSSRRLFALIFQIQITTPVGSTGVCSEAIVSIFRDNGLVM